MAAQYDVAGLPGQGAVLVPAGCVLGYVPLAEDGPVVRRGCVPASSTTGISTSMPGISSRSGRPPAPLLRRFPLRLALAGGLGWRVAAGQCHARSQEQGCEVGQDGWAISASHRLNDASSIGVQKVRKGLDAERQAPSSCRDKIAAVASRRCKQSDGCAVLSRPIPHDKTYWPGCSRRPWAAASTHHRPADRRQHAVKSVLPPRAMTLCSGAAWRTATTRSSGS